MDVNQIKEQDKIKQEKAKLAKRECAKRSRQLAKQKGELTPSDQKQEKLRLIKQTINGGNTHVNKLIKNNITLDTLTQFANQNSLNLDKVKPHIIEFLKSPDILNPSKNNQFDKIFTKEYFDNISKSTSTTKSYISHFNSIKTLLLTNSNDVLVDFIINKPDIICLKIHDKYKKSTTSYVSAIIWLIENVQIIKDVISENNKKYYTDQNKLFKQMYPKTNKTEGKLSWDQIIELKTYIEPKHKYGLYHLLLSLYTCIPPMRDDFGCVIIVENERQMNIINNEQITQESNYNENKHDDIDQQINKTYNFYVKNNHTFHFNHYKTAKHYGPIKFKAPTYLQDVIYGSLEQDPRLYLVTKDHNLDQQTYIDGTLAGITKKLF